MEEDNEHGNISENSDILMEEIHDETNELLASASNKRSMVSKNPIHNYFTYDSVANESSCNYCPSKIKKKFPTNLEKHLRSKHPNEFKKFQLEKQAKEIPDKVSTTSSVSSSHGGQESIEQSFRKLQKKAVGIQKNTFEYKKIEHSIAIAFVANSLPYRLVEDGYIRNMFEQISDSRWKGNFPTRAEISEKISESAKNLKENVASNMKNAKLYSITIDLWSRPGFSSGFVGVTCHFYNRTDEKLEVALLACKKIQQPHTGDSIYQIFQTVLQEWQLDDDKILRIVTDNGANIVKAFR
jgi:hypothetical protein